MPVQMAETWPLLLLFRPGNKASSCTCKDQTTCMNIQAYALEMLTLTRAEMEEQVATPLDHSLIQVNTTIESYVMDSFMAKS